MLGSNILFALSFAALKPPLLTGYLPEGWSAEVPKLDASWVPLWLVEKARKAPAEKVRSP